MAGCPSCRQPDDTRSGMSLGASIAFAFNSLAQGPVTRKSCRRRESNPGPRDSRPDALATLPPRFAGCMHEHACLNIILVTALIFLHCSAFGDFAKLHIYLSLVILLTIIDIGLL